MASENDITKSDIYHVDESGVPIDKSVMAWGLSGGDGGAFADTNGDGVAELHEDHTDFKGGDARNVGALNTEQVNNIQYLQAGGSPSAVINNTAVGDVVIVEPGNRFTVTQTLSPTIGVSIVNFGAVSDDVNNRNPTFLKSFNGPLLEVNHGFNAYGIHFEANKTNGYTGDAVTTASAGIQGVTFNRCLIERAAGDGVAGDGLVNSSFYDCEIRRNDGRGVYLHASTTTESSVVYIDPNTTVKQNGSHGVQLDDAAAHDIRISGNIELNGGPGVYATAYSDMLHLDGKYNDNDGPGVMVATGSTVNSITVSGRVRDNNKNPTTPAATRVGEIHVEGTGTQVDVLYLNGASITVPNTGQSNDFIVVDNPDLVNIAMSGVKFGPFTNVSNAIDGGGVGNTVVTGVGVRNLVDTLTTNCSGLSLQGEGRRLEDLQSGAELFFDAGELKVTDSGGTTTTLS